MERKKIPMAYNPSPVTARRFGKTISGKQAAP
jgi:hypothetical protein